MLHYDFYMDGMGMISKAIFPHVPLSWVAGLTSHTLGRFLGWGYPQIIQVVRA